MSGTARLVRLTGMADEEEQSWTDQAATWASETYEQAATAVSETYEQAATGTGEVVEQAATGTGEVVEQAATGTGEVVEQAAGSATETADNAAVWAEQTYQDAETWVGENADAATTSYETASGVAIAEKGVADAAEDAAGNTEFMRITWARTKYDLVLTKHQLLQRLSSAYADATAVAAQGEAADPHACEAIGHILDADAETATSAVNLAGDSFADDADRFHNARLNILEAAGAARWGALIDAVDRQSHLDAVPTLITTAITILQGISEDGTDPDYYLPATSY